MPPTLSKTSLWRAWKDVRAQLRRASLRDVTDYFEFDVDPQEWIDKLFTDIREGTYEPATPYRFRLAKSMGFNRQMTMPRIRDLVVYRAITGLVLSRAGRPPGRRIHFSRNTIAKHRADITSDGYGYLSGSAFLEWMKFNQYRHHLLIDQLCPFIVLTDITNYFDSILFDRIIDAAMKSKVNTSNIGLLRFLLERLAIRDSYGESPRIGLPVDEFDCSRTLAHIVLFDHDIRMLKRVGEERYARWMDDQAFGVSSRAEGLQVLRACGQSLARLHLTPNVSKSRILTLEEASRHFHFDANDALDQIEESLPDNPKHAQMVNPRVTRIAFAGVWRGIRLAEQHRGEWAKVASRAYRIAGRLGIKYLRYRARKDILNYPTLAKRIGDYMVATGTALQFLDFAQGIWSTDEQVHPDVNILLFERLLRVEATGTDASKIRWIAREFLGRRKTGLPGKDTMTAIAPLLILRFGDRRSLTTLRKVVRNLGGVHPAVGKAAAVVYASYGPKEYREVVRAASKQRDNHLADFLSMLEVARGRAGVPNRFLVRREPYRDSISGRWRLDVRKVLVLRLLRLNRHPSVTQWLMDAKAYMLSRDISQFDKEFLARMLK